MAVAILDSIQASTTSVVTSISTAGFTVPAGSDRIVLGVHVARRGSTYDSDSISDGTTNFTFFTQYDVDYSDECAVYYLLEADILSGSQTYTATASGSARHALWIIALSGVDQTTPLNGDTGSSTATDTGGPGSTLDVTSASDEIAFDYMSVYAATQTASGTSQNLVDSVIAIDSINMAVSEITGESTASFDYTWSGSREWHRFGWNANAAAAAASGAHMLTTLGAG